MLNLPRTESLSQTLALDNTSRFTGQLTTQFTAQCTENTSRTDF